MSAEPAESEVPGGGKSETSEPKTPLWRRAVRVVVLLAFLAIIAVFVVYAVPQVIGADHSYVVLTASMSPAIEPGDAVVVGETEPAEITEGDVITFHRSADEPPVTHRVIGVTETDDGYLYETKGDANEEPDANPVPHENVVGTVIVTIPYLGHVMQFTNTTKGFLAFVIVPFGLLLLSEAYSLVGSSRRGVDSGPGDENREDTATGNGDGLVLTPSTLRAAIGVLAVVAPTSAYVAVQHPAAITITVAVAASISLLVIVGIRLLGGAEGSDDSPDPDDPTERTDPTPEETGDPVADGAGGAIDETDDGTDPEEGSR